MQRDSNNEATATASPGSPREVPWVLAAWPEGNAHRELPREGAIIIGRGDDCDFVVRHRSVSRHHVKLDVGPPMTIEDLGSANGTKLRGRRLAPHQPEALECGVAIEIGDVSLLVHQPSRAARVESSPLARELAKVERDRIVDTLARCGGNQTRAARLLGISRRTLVNRLAEYDLPRPLKGRR
jgi:pSer/pThr/pTyr-binding forkhead associated (FHA) protein